MNSSLTRKVRGSAIITANNEVFFTPYRKLEDDEKPQRPIAACKIGSLTESKNCYILRLTFAKNTSRQYLIQEFVKPDNDTPVVTKFSHHWKIVG